MFDANEDAGSNGKRILWMSLCGFGIIMLLGAITGFLSAHMEEGGSTLDGVDYAILVLFISLVFILGGTSWKLFQPMKQNFGKGPRREQLNRNIIWACTGLGGITGLALAASGISNTSGDFLDPFTPLLTGPLPLHIVAPLVIMWGVIIPAIAWYWHRYAIDEQEANAYRDGGYYAGYAFLMLTPLWWLLWRGGLLPEPDGVTIYFLFSIIWAIIWFWKKYR